MKKLVLLRHGESQWNLENRFTGWTNVDLTEKGEEEAREAGELLNQEAIKFSVVHTSLLQRANRTMEICIDQMGLTKVSKKFDWRLNERHYGGLQGLNKAETAEKHGDEQVLIWRRSYDIPPPGGDSLKTTAERTIPCLLECIEPELQQQHNCLVSAHGNSLRSIIMHIEKLSPEDVVNLEIPTGQPRLYEFTDNHYQKLGD